MNWNSFLDFFVDLGVSFGVKILTAVVVLFVGLKLIKWFKKWIKTSVKLSKVDDGVRSFVSSFGGITLYIVLFITIAMILGIPTTSFITALASCGVAIGLAMQGFLGNFAGGLMILIFKPFKVGDFIETVDASGTVREITVVYTVLSTPDNKVITIPNGTLTNSTIQNYSSVENRRVDLDFNVSYDSDIEQVKSILMDVLNSHPEVLKDPEPFARLSSHSDSALTYTVRAWCKNEKYWDVRFDIVESVKNEFDKNNIKIPYPQVDVHLDK